MAPIKELLCSPFSFWRKRPRSALLFYLICVFGMVIFFTCGWANWQGQQHHRNLQLTGSEEPQQSTDGQAQVLGAAHRTAKQQQGSVGAASADEVAVLRAKLMAAERETDTLKAKLAASEKERKDLQKSMDEMQAKWTADVQELQLATNSSLTEMEEKCRAAMEETENDVEECEGALSVCKEHAKEMDKAMEEAQEKLEYRWRLIEHCRDVQRELQVHVQVTSWMATEHPPVKAVNKTATHYETDEELKKAAEQVFWTLPRLPKPAVRSIEVLGAGEFATVKLAKADGYGIVVHKQMKPKQRHYLEELLFEAGLLALVNHTNVLRPLFIVDGPSGKAEDVVGLGLEYMEIGPLSHYMESLSEKIPEPVAVSLMLDLLAGLEAMHAHSVVHCDIKPPNLLMMRRPDGSVMLKVADLGLARPFEHMPKTGKQFGTLRYMAPEVGINGSQLTYKLDIWSVGAVMWHLGTGTEPMGDDPNKAVWKRIRDGSIVDVLQPPKDSDYSSAWWDIVKQCLNLDQHQRPDPVELRAKLMDLMNSFAATISAETRHQRLQQLEELEEEEEEEEEEAGQQQGGEQEEGEDDGEDEGDEEEEGAAAQPPPSPQAQASQEQQGQGQQQQQAPPRQRQHVAGISQQRLNGGAARMRQKHAEQHPVT